MEAVFLNLLNMSITATWIALAVILLRFLLKKSPKWVMGVLWGFVALRLVCPFSIESIFSLIPSTQTVQPSATASGRPVINSGFNFIDSGANDYLGDRYYEGITVPANTGEFMLKIAVAVWLLGMLAMLVYTVISFLRIRKKVGEAVETSDRVWRCDRISTPFILGIIKPKIYLPSSMSEGDTEYVLAHEMAHLKRRDHLWKPFGFLLLTVYWFNPVLWLVYSLLCRDIELACDEKVIKEKGIGIKKPYSEALINCSVPRRMVAACPLAFGEVGVKERVKSVLNYKKPAFWIIIVAVIACAVAAVCLLTNPTDTKIDSSLSVFLDTTIASHHRRSGISEDPFICVDYKILGTEKSGAETTLYMWVLYQEYSYDGELHKDSGSHTPTAVTVSKKAEADGLGYELVEYWEPGMGSQFGRDIRDKFPLHLQRKALDSQWCIAEQQANCLKSAQQYFKTSSAPADVSVPETTVTQPAENKNPYFNATVLEVYDGSALVEPFEGTDERKSSDKISISLNVISTNPVPALKKGDEIRVVYNGTIAETYPAQIDKVFAVYSLDKNGEVIYLQSEPVTDTVSGMQGVFGKPLITVQANSSKAVKLTDSDFNKKYGFDVYSYGVESVKINADGNYTDASTVLNSGKITPEQLVGFAKADAKKTEMYKDGGSEIFISYDDGGSTAYPAGSYALLKLNRLDGNKDIYIGTPDLNINEIV